MSNGMNIYNGDEPYIFISYAHKDADVVIPLVRGLQKRGFRIWYDNGIEYGYEWPEYIATKLFGCGCALAFVTPSAVNSKNCRREINFAIDKNKELLIIYLEEFELPLGMQLQLNTLQAMHFTDGDVEGFLNKLCRASILKPCLGAAPEQPEEAPKQPQPAPQPAPQPVQQGGWNGQRPQQPMQQPMQRPVQQPMQRPQQPMQTGNSWNAQRPQQPVQTGNSWNAQRPQQPMQRPQQPTQTGNSWNAQRPQQPVQTGNSWNAQRPQQPAQTGNSWNAQRPQQPVQTGNSWNAQRPQQPVQTGNSWNAQRPQQPVQQPVQRPANDPGSRPGGVSSFPGGKAYAPPSRPTNGGAGQFPGGSCSASSQGQNSQFGNKTLDDLFGSIFGSSHKK